MVDGHGVGVDETHWMNVLVYAVAPGICIISGLQYFKITSNIIKLSGASNSATLLIKALNNMKTLHTSRGSSVIVHAASMQENYHSSCSISCEVWIIEMPVVYCNKLHNRWGISSHGKTFQSSPTLHFTPSSTTSQIGP
jgi:hypothetical protein